MSGQFKRLPILCFFCFFGLFSPLKAQKYITAAGIRVGSDLGITVQQLIYGRSTLELILQTNPYRYSAAALGQYHFRVLGKRLNYYYGLGPHLGEEKGYGMFYGLSTMVGAELTMGGVTASVDYKPAINLKGGSSYVFHDMAFSLRHIIIKRKAKPIIDFDKLFPERKSKKKKDKDKTKKKWQFWKKDKDN